MCGTLGESQTSAPRATRGTGAVAAIGPDLALCWHPAPKYRLLRSVAATLSHRLRRCQRRPGAHRRSRVGWPGRWTAGDRLGDRRPARSTGWWSYIRSSSHISERCPSFRGDAGGVRLWCLQRPSLLARPNMARGRVTPQAGPVARRERATHDHYRHVALARRPAIRRLRPCDWSPPPISLHWACLRAPLPTPSPESPPR
jgi:hypothetical protein